MKPEKGKWYWVESVRGGYAVEHRKCVATTDRGGVFKLARRHCERYEHQVLAEAGPEADPPRRWWQFWKGA